MTGISASISRARVISVMPSIPGMRMSVRMTPLKPWRDEVERTFGAVALLDPQSFEVERLRGRAPKFLLVVDQQHDWRLHSAASASPSATASNSTEKIAPPAGSLSTLRRPPKSLTML